MIPPAPTLAPDAAYVARKAHFWENTDYDRAFRGSFGRYMTDVETRALERIFPTSPVALLVDVGCGHGRFLRWLAPRARRLVGLDRSRRLLGVAQDDLARAPLAAPTGLLWGSATDLPLASHSVDTITCVRVVQHVPDQDAALREATRVLRPGGHLVLVQYNVASPHGLIRALKLPVKAALRRGLRATGLEPHFDEPTRWTNVRALRRQLEAAGLTVDRITGAWLFPLQYFRSRGSNEAFWPFLRIALAIEALADRAPFKYLGGYLVVRCRKN